MYTSAFSRIEPLEHRIAPATLAGNVLSYTDTDGDLVTIKFTTKAALTEANFIFDNAFATAGAQVLQRIDLTAADPLLEGTAIAMTVKTPAGVSGNGRADLGVIDATGHDIGNVTLKGDLGRVLAGNADDKPGLGNLSVYSLGARGTATQPAGGNLTSFIKGSAGNITVTDDIDQARIYIAKALNGPANLGAVSIGGDVLGGAASSSGQIATADGSIKSVTIGGNLSAGTNAFTGYIFASTGVGSVKIGGNLTAGGLPPSGAIFSGGDTTKIEIAGNYIGGFIRVIGKLGAFKVGGNMEGTSETAPGSVTASKGIATIEIGGDLTGGVAATSGVIFSGGDTTKVTIGNDVNGGRVQIVGHLGSASIGRDLIGRDQEASGEISATAGLGKITIGRDITGGSVTGTGGIRVEGDLGSVTVKGTITGTLDSTGLIYVTGTLKAGTITGDLRGGSENSSGIIRGDAGIGTLTVKGSVLGAGGGQSGAIESGGAFGALTIAGDVRGGAGEYSGYIGGGTGLKSLTIGGEFVGGTADNSGVIGVQGPLGTLKLGKSMTGGTAKYSGSIFALSLGSATVGGDVIGGTGASSGSFLIGAGNGSGTGSIAPAIKSLTVKGSIKSGTGTDSGSVFADGPIIALTVMQDVVGNATAPVVIGAVTTAAANATKNLSIGSVKILGSISDSIIRAGGATDLPDRADGQIGSVFIGRDFVRSSIVASVKDVNGDGFGNGDDTRNTAVGDSAKIVSSIASVIIKGAVTGTAGTTDHFGIVAEVIGAVTVGKTKIVLTKGASNDFAKVLNTDLNGNVLLNELAAAV
jgi:hypothetical protein